MDRCTDRHHITDKGLKTALNSVQTISQSVIACSLTECEIVIRISSEMDYLFAKQVNLLPVEIEYILPKFR